MHQLQIQNDNSCKTSSQTNKQTNKWRVCFFGCCGLVPCFCCCINITRHACARPGELFWHSTRPVLTLPVYHLHQMARINIVSMPQNVFQSAILLCINVLCHRFRGAWPNYKGFWCEFWNNGFTIFFSAEVSFGRMCLHVDLEPHLRESWQPETWGERVCRSWLLPCWQRQADRTLWRARPIASGLWYSHRSVWPVETTECWGRCRCQGGQHSYHLGDADWHCAAVPLLPAAAAHRQPVCAAAPWGWVWWVCGELFAVFFLWREVSGLILTKCSLRHCHFVFLVQTGCAKFVKTNRIAEFLDKKTDCTQDCVTGMMSQDVTGCHSCESASPYLNQICRFYFLCLKLNGVVTVARFCSFYSDFFESVMAVPSDMLRHLSICAALVNSAASFEPPPNQTKHIVHSLQGSYLVSSGIYIYIYIYRCTMFDSQLTPMLFSVDVMLFILSML